MAKLFAKHAHLLLQYRKLVPAAARFALREHSHPTFPSIALTVSPAPTTIFLQMENFACLALLELFQKADLKLVFHALQVHTTLQVFALPALLEHLTT